MTRLNAFALSLSLSLFSFTARSSAQEKPAEKKAAPPAATPASGQKGGAAPATPAAPPAGQKGGAASATPAAPPAGQKGGATPATPATPPAGQPAEMKPPAPTPELEAAAKAMKGNWKCTGTSFMGGKEIPVQGTISWKQDVEKMWLVGTWKSKKTKENPAPMTAVEYRIYDPSTKKWNSLSFDSMGSWATMSAPAAEGKMNWQGKGTMIGMNGQTIGFRMTEEMTGPKTVKIGLEMSMDGKTWSPAWTAECKK